MSKAQCAWAVALLVLGVGCSQRRAVGISPAAIAAGRTRALPAEEFFVQKRWQGPGPLPGGRYVAARTRLHGLPHYSLARRRYVSEGASAIELGNWQSLGPGNVAGRTKVLATDPANPGTMYAASAEGGIWKSVDSGQDWSPLTDSLPVLAMSGLAMDPTDSQILYAGSGEQLPGAGIFKSIDGGQTWRQLPQSAAFQYVFSISISPARAQNLYAATESGVWASFDGGITWNESLAAAGGCYSTAVRSDSASDIVFATCSQTDGYPLVALQVGLWTYPPGGSYAIYRTEIPSGGRTGPVLPVRGRVPTAAHWENVLTAANMGPTVLAIAPSAPDTVYALATSSDPNSPFNEALLGLYASDAGGKAGTWELRANTSDPSSITANILSYIYPSVSGCVAAGLLGAHAGQGGWDLGLAVDPTDSQTLFASGVELSRSQDGGRTFTGITSASHGDFHGWAIPPAYNGASNQTIYITNDGGIFQITNARTQVTTKSQVCSQPFYSINGTSLNHSLQVTQFYHGVVMPGGGLLMGGSQDTSTVLGSAASPDSWTAVYGGDGGMSAFDPADPNTAYFEYEGLAFARSTDGGVTSTPATMGIVEAATDFPFVTYFVLDPNHSEVLYIGGHQLWRSADGAQTWSAAGPDTGAPISAIVVNPRNSNQVLYGDNSGAIYNGTMNSGANGWASRRPRGGYVSDIVFDSGHTGSIYATYSTFRAQPGDGQVYVSSDGGNSWSAVGVQSLPDIPVHVLLPDPDNASTLYAGTDLGIFVSFDSGATWANDASFPAVITTGLQMDKNGAAKYLYAFTYGRGAWKVNLTPGAAECTYSVSPSQLTVSPDGAANAITVNTAPGCAWSASAASSRPYLHLQSPAAGVGPGTLYFSVSGNYRGATVRMPIYVQDQTVEVVQAASSSGFTTFDSLSGAEVISSLPFYRAGGYNGLTSAASDPVHSCTGSRDVGTGWFLYTASTSHTIDASASTGGVPGVLAAYPMRNGVLGAEIGCVTNSSNTAVSPSLVFPVTAGTTYAIEVAGVGAVLGSFGYVGVTVQALPAVTIGGGAASVAPGQTTQFTAAVSGSANGAVRWTAQFGAIDRNGNYTAPSVAAGQSVTDTISAISFADANASASVSVLVVGQ